MPAARLMVDALRLSTLQNPLRCRVDKARRSLSGIWYRGRARRIHQGPRDVAQIWNCCRGVRGADQRPDACYTVGPAPHTQGA
ncbi:hypothetical protein [uncultured Lamprocystis sp.]|uniref:hypothetical protein n=1 Tax=uncultured Lamprocystis sp. TaxID=543132 RepID=UPI0025E295EF|nr:hypothetical protein [uncultured Lamprocystis sp.]